MRIVSHKQANEANYNDMPKPAQSLRTPVPRQKTFWNKSLLSSDIQTSF